MTQENEWPKKITMYLHSDKEKNWNLGEEIGLSDEAISHKFKYALHEIAIEVLVQETGDIEILTVDGRTLGTEESK